MMNANVPSARRVADNRARCGFTLLELLVVIGIIALLAGLSAPVLNHFKPNITAAATRQLLDDLSRARQLAISQRTTVYMVFVPPNVWNLPNLNRLAASNLLEKQLTGYTFVSLRSVGDQPGQSYPRYLSGWRTLPEGSFIALEKFSLPSFPVYNKYIATGFSYTNTIPFPVDASVPPYPSIPYIAFDYMGRLTDGAQVLQRDEIIPLARGTVSVSRDPGTKVPNGLSYSVTENPPGNATDSSYNVVVVDWLTGRAHAERMEAQ